MKMKENLLSFVSEIQIQNKKENLYIRLEFCLVSFLVKKN